jgi:multimeric flavodoxin WrbA
MDKPRVRRLETYRLLEKAQFRARFFARFADPAFDAVQSELERVCEIAWSGYQDYRKSPRKRPAGEGFSDPAFELSSDWLETRAAIRAAEARFADASGPSRLLLINGSTRSEHSCPGEISKTRRLVYAARDALESVEGTELDFLDLSLLAEEPLKVIHPCKSCVSTAMPLCHWPCSCYPNHALGQVNDWMSEIYPRWVAAHGVMIVCPVHWYQAPSSLKLMIDRLVCADGGNPDPTTTRDKDPALAKELELSGWHYPRHLAGRAFAVVTHADAAGAGGLRQNLCDWLRDIGMIDAGASAMLDRYIGYYRPYATSHDDLDADPDVFQEVRHAALSLSNSVRTLRSGEYRAPDSALDAPRKK